MCLVLLQIGLLVDVLESTTHSDEEKAAARALIGKLSASQCELACNDGQKRANSCCN